MPPIQICRSLCESALIKVATGAIFSPGIGGKLVAKFKSMGPKIDVDSGAFDRALAGVVLALEPGSRKPSLLLWLAAAKLHKGLQLKKKAE